MSKAPSLTKRNKQLLIHFIIAFVIVLSSSAQLAFLYYLHTYPSSKNLVRWYLEAVIHQNQERAFQLSHRECHQLYPAFAQRDIQQLGGAEIRNVSVQVMSGEGSDDTIEVAEARFEYRKSPQVDWRSGKVAVTTSPEGTKDRHILCE